MTIRHVVSWKLAAEDADLRREHAEEIKRRLSGLVGVVPQIGTLSVGENVAYPESNWDVCLVIDFASLEDLDGYQVHPAHQEAAGFIRSVVGQRSSVDFEL